MNGDTTSRPMQQERAGTAEAVLAGRILLVASIIVNVIEGDEFLVIASVLSIVAGLLTVKSAQLESVEQQIAPGVTTFANGLKLIGSYTSVFVSVILLWALLIEISLRQVSPIGVGPALAGSTGAFRV